MTQLNLFKAILKKPFGKSSPAAMKTSPLLPLPEGSDKHFLCRFYILCPKNSFATELFKICSFFLLWENFTKRGSPKPRFCLFREQQLFPQRKPFQPPLKIWCQGLTDFFPLKKALPCENIYFLQALK